MLYVQYWLMDFILHKALLLIVFLISGPDVSSFLIELSAFVASILVQFIMLFMLTAALSSHF